MNKAFWMIKFEEIIKLMLELLYPAKCPFCGRIVPEGICGRCREKVITVREPLCKKCGKPVRNEREEFCYDCKEKSHLFEDGRSLWVHQSPVSEAVYAMKYQNRRIYGKIFGNEMAEKYGQYLKERQVDLIVPIPLHKKRKRKRGYNQAEILARTLSEAVKIPMADDVLIRVKETCPQKSLNDKERRRNIRGAFEVKKRLTGRKIVLIDDIYTTGSTLDEAAKTLLGAGAEKVYFLTISIGQGF